jgi:hypothetical protein
VAGSLWAGDRNVNPLDSRSFATAKNRYEKEMNSAVANAADAEDLRRIVDNVLIYGDTEQKVALAIVLEKAHPLEAIRLYQKAALFSFHALLRCEQFGGGLSPVYAEFVQNCVQNDGHFSYPPNEKRALCRFFYDKKNTLCGVDKSNCVLIFAKLSDDPEIIDEVLTELRNGNKAALDVLDYHIKHSGFFIAKKYVESLIRIIQFSDESDSRLDDIRSEIMELRHKCFQRILSILNPLNVCVPEARSFIRNWLADLPEQDMEFAKTNLHQLHTTSFIDAYRILLSHEEKPGYPVLINDILQRFCMREDLDRASILRFPPSFLRDPDPLLDLLKIFMQFQKYRMVHTVSLFLKKPLPSSFERYVDVLLEKANDFINASPDVIKACYENEVLFGVMAATEFDPERGMPVFLQCLTVCPDLIANDTQDERVRKYARVFCDFAKRYHKTPGLAGAMMPVLNAIVLRPGCPLLKPRCIEDSFIRNSINRTVQILCNAPWFE